jgi:hypothetical protein
MEFGIIQIYLSLVFLLTAVTVTVCCERFRKGHELGTVAVKPGRPVEVASQQRVRVLPDVTVDAFLWEHWSRRPALADRPEPVAPASRDTRADARKQMKLIRGNYQLHTPTGAISEAALQKLLKINKDFCGLVVSIGINGDKGHRDARSTVSNFVASLLGPHDFSCEISAGEYTIVCPVIRRSDTEVRLSEITDQVSKFQVRAACSLSWGAAAAHKQRLVVAVAPAGDRMRQMKSGGHRFSRAV